MKKRRRDLVILIDGTRSSLNELGVCFKYFPRVLSYLEFFTWCLINGLNPLAFKIYFSLGGLDPKHDVLFNFSFTTLDAFPKNNTHNLFSRYQGLVFTHLTHYLRNTKLIAENLNHITHNVLVAEADLTKNRYFKHYFPEERHVYQLPFCFQNRFKDLKPFKERVNKCFAVGTCSTLGSEYESFFGKNASFHYMRKVIHEKRSEITQFIDSYIANFDDARNLDQIKPNDSLFIKLAKKYLPYFILVKILPNFFTRYYQFNIVEKYNEYRMFISPEEVFGLPSINAFEGMACGAALIAIDNPMYTNLGLIPGIHYIAYKENDLKSLISTIEYYQHNPDKLETIAKKGREFVREHFSEQNIAEVFWKDLQHFSDEFAQGNSAFRCSFKL